VGIRARKLLSARRKFSFDSFQNLRGNCRRIKWMRPRVNAATSAASSGRYLVTVRQLHIVQAGFYASLAFFTFGIAEPLGGWIADSLIRRGWNETATRKGIITVAFSMGIFLIAAMRSVHTGVAIGSLIAASLVGIATGNLLAILQKRWGSGLERKISQETSPVSRRRSR
jgi:MFS family permease